MACKASYELYHNFPKLAEEAGFAFNTHRPRVHIEWNKIRLIDIENLVRERKFVLIEKHINDILDCVLESEFDVRILDEGVLKLFRLAQLAVEYQQFCRHYLDRSVYVLREEVTSLAKEIESCKRSLKEKEDELRRTKKKSRHTIQNPLPYGSDNIATMILNTLRNQSDIFPNAPHIDLKHNKCQYCDKVFLNELYLKSHLSRRHPNVTEIAQKDLADNTNTNTEVAKLETEIDNLKRKLNEMENALNLKQNKNAFPENDIMHSTEIKTNSISEKKEFKNAEVQDDEMLLKKMEEWKKEEYDKYNKEINTLTLQIKQLIEIDKEKNRTNNETKLIEQLQMTIRQQNTELSNLREELLNSNSARATIEAEGKKEIERQISLWSKKVDEQSIECKTLLQRLNDTIKELCQYKEVAHAERAKALQLQNILNKETQKHKCIGTETKMINTNVANELVPKAKPNKNTPVPDRITLEKLQKQAEELLNADNSTTDASSTSEESKAVSEAKVLVYPVHHMNKPDNTVTNGKRRPDKIPRDVLMKGYNKKKTRVNKEEEKVKKKKSKTIIPASPIKVVRAKITEDVNERLVQLGVDPLKRGLSKNMFLKQKKYMQEQQELKAKKNPSREKIYHSILTQLDSNTTKLENDMSPSKIKASNKINKTFSISSVLSNVKTKALSLMKSSDITDSKKRNVENDFEPSSIAKQNSPEAKDVTPFLPHSIDKTRKTGVAKQEPNIAAKKKVTSDFSFSNEEPSENKDLKIVKGSPFKSTDKGIIERSLHTENIKINSSSDDIESIVDDIMQPRKAFSEESLNVHEKKGVLRNASSTSSLNKKKVLFDMDAIQMKSISASPSQSYTEKSDSNEKYTLGIINLDEDWDPPSTENENLINPTIQVSTRTSPKISELKQAIESQMARRIQTPSTALAGSVNLLPTPKPMVRTSLGGSNTSLGSSILDGSESPSISKPNQNAATKEIKRDDSDIDLSEILAGDNKF